ncbi:MAG: GMC family oxidoreductase [Planctomycetes bacterium]|nr:GMC family oxidoreductase [Planctomycetota bacterium]MCP4860474.1 GMC family oxidoreductase [Planctomycetota bacterium]
MEAPWPWVVIGSGFGGSVAGLRLVEKGHRVLMIEQGGRFQASDYPRSNWNLRRWLWAPAFGCRGIFRISLFRHLTAFSGVGVGGGSLVYANTLPTPPDRFFESPNWQHLADWKQDLAPFYETALEMLGATETPFLTAPDLALQKIALERDQAERFRPTRVAVYFGEEDQTVDDPYFNGEGPTRTGCNRCGGCMIGCQNNAKNSLDKNYLYLAEKRGLEIQADTRVVAVRPHPEGGYTLELEHSFSRWSWVKRPQKRTIRAEKVVFSGGVLGTVPLLQEMAADPNGMPNLSPKLGNRVRTNSEALMGVINKDAKEDLSTGVAIGSIYQTDEYSHIEPVRYPSGSGFFRLLIAPHAPGNNFVARLVAGVVNFAKKPWAWMRTLLIRDFAANSAILLYMRSTESTLRLRRGGLFGMKTELEEGPAPSANMPPATELAEDVAKELDGVTGSLVSESLLGIPSTAHILGGCCMGATPSEGVIDSQNRLFGHPDCYVVDGSAISANPGVNPSLTITALAERAMSFIPPASA